MGGAGGYLFGRLTLLDKITFIFLIIGILNFFYKILFRKNIDSLFILTIVFITFLTGMVLTAPPPAFHRISLIFPIICLILGATIGDIYMFIKKQHKTIGFIVLLLCISLISISNIFHFKKVLLNDGPDDPDYPQIQRYLTKEGKNFFYVAAFESYGMGKILFIRSEGKILSITKSLEEILKIIPQNETSFLVILYPNEEKIKKTKEKFPNTTIISNYGAHTLLRIN